MRQYRRRGCARQARRPALKYSLKGGGTIALHDGDVIIVGTSNSLYAFKFRIG